MTNNPEAGCFSAEVRDQIEDRIAFLSQSRDSLTCDADTHISDPDMISESCGERLAGEPNYFHGRPIDGPQLIREMDGAGVDMALSWQNPSATCYGNDRDQNYATLLRANEYIVHVARTYPTRIFPAGWTDPKAVGVENAKNMAEECVCRLGFSLVKLNPAQNAYAIDSDDVVTVVQRIVELGAVPAFHFGPDTPYTPVDGLERLAAEFPEQPILGIHFGGGGGGYVESEQFYHDARAMGLRRTNVYFIQSAKRDTHAESDFITYRLAGPQHWRRIFVGSDAPYGRQSWNFGGYRQMFKYLAEGSNHTDARVRDNPDLFDEQAAQDFLGRNFADFAVSSCRRILEVNG